MTGDEVLQDRPDRPVVRVGGTVRHPRQPWTPSVHALLRHLAGVGFRYAPRVVGVDGDDEVLTYLPGASGPDGWAPAVDEAGLTAAARLLREYHDAVAGWNPGPGVVWADGSTGGGAEGPDGGTLVCHGDYGPWNLVWDGLRPVGILDWEYAHVGSPLDDVAYALEYLAPFRGDEDCVRWMRYPAPPDRRRRLELFATAYGLTGTEGLADRVIARQRATLNLVRRLAAQGHARQRDALAAGEEAETAARIQWSEEHRHLFA